MTGPTHLTCGIAASLFLCGDFVSGLILSVGSILPDIDSRNSLLGKSLPFIPKFIKHRTITHSILFLFGCYFINVYLFYGCCLHILLDMMTKMGCPLLWPIGIDFKLPFAWFTKTGGWVEGIVFSLSLIAVILLIINKFAPLL